MSIQHKKVKRKNGSTRYYRWPVRLRESPLFRDADLECDEVSGASAVEDVGLP